MGRPVHFEVHATDPEALVAFYTLVFGWTFNRWGEEAYWLAETGEGPGINGAVLPRTTEAPASGAPVNGMVVTIEVPDLGAALTLAYANGATEALPRMAVPGVGWLAYVQDPDHNVIGILEPDETAA